MVEVECPNCGHRFPIAALDDTTGSCVCGIDYRTTIYAGVLTLSWTPDPRYPQSGTERKTTKVILV